jgi:DNA-binding beta-propeller fold protein YncE
MRLKLGYVFSLALSLITASAGLAAEPKLLWTATEGMDNPESAYYSADDDTIYLSNIGGEGAAKDGQGWISKLSPKGEVLEAKWVTGLNAPKGIRIHGDTLWVSDIDELVAINRKTGKVEKRIPAEGAKFLNDVAVTKDGTVYVTDTQASKVYECKGDKLTLVAEGEAMENPNGCLVHEGKLIVGGFGRGGEKPVLGHLFVLDPKTKEKTLLTKDTVAHIDGLEADGNGGWVISDWLLGKVSHIDREGKIKTLLELAQGTADISYLPRQKLLILPRMKDNKVEAYQLEL